MGRLRGNSAAALFAAATITSPHSDMALTPDAAAPAQTHYTAVAAHGALPLARAIRPAAFFAGLGPKALSADALRELRRDGCGKLANSNLQMSTPPLIH